MRRPGKKLNVGLLKQDLIVLHELVVQKAKEVQSRTEPGEYSDELRHIEELEWHLKIAKNRHKFMHEGPPEENPFSRKWAPKDMVEVPNEYFSR